MTSQPASQPPAIQPPATQPPVHTLIVNGGPPPDPRVLHELPPNPYTIAVDRGYEHAQHLGLPIHELLGDFDSLDPALVRHARAQGVLVEQHPTAKDATDLELALFRAASFDAAQVSVIGGNGWEDRFDHIAGQLGLFANPAFASLNLTIWLGATCVRPVHASLEMEAAIGQTVSLIAIGGPVRGVTTTNLAYPLLNESLDPFTTRSVSNVCTHTSFHVNVREGALLAILPDLLDHRESTPPKDLS